MSSIKLEVGKFYRLRNGGVVGPIEQSTLGGYPFEIKSSDLAIDCWLSNGRVWDSAECEHDLVEEVPDPAAALKTDAVNRPAHYTAGGIECIDAIKAAMTPEQFKGYLRGNAMKYLWRHEHKGGIEDLHKAGWYLNKLVEVA